MQTFCGAVVESTHMISGWLTELIALIAVFIAYQQWKTSQDRAALDVFDRRMSTYEEIRASVKPIVQNGTCGTQEYLDLARSADRVKFLFGPEVVDYCDRLLDDANVLGLYTSYSGSHCTLPAGMSWAKRAETFKRIASFYDEFPKLISPYVSVTAKRVPTVREWIANTFKRRA